MKDNNRFRYLLQTAIDLYSKTQKRSFSNVLDEMNDQLGYGHNSMTIQTWLRENTIPNSAEVEYLAKKILASTNLDFEWAKSFFYSAGFDVPQNMVFRDIKVKNIDDSRPIMSVGDIYVYQRGYVEQPGDIFISYARTDVDIVQSIYNILLSKNHRPWMDVYSIKGGENWLQAVNEAIDECQIFLAVLSNNSVSRRGVIQKELKKALDKFEGMLPDDIYIIPIRIDDCPIPELLKHIQALDWDSGKGEKKLLEAIRIGLKRRTEA